MPTDSPLTARRGANTPLHGPWPLSRAQAFCLHLTLSLLVFSTLVVVMVSVWFPGRLFALDGGWEGLKLVAMVDLVLGPVLTLLLYRPGKRGVRLDLSLIAAVQVAALGYGFVVTWQQRPVAVVYADGLFNTLSASAHRTANRELTALGATPGRIGRVAGEGLPVLVHPPPTGEEFGAYLARLFNGWPEPHERSDRLVPAARAPGTLAQGALTLDEIDRGTRVAVEAALLERRDEADAVQLHRFRTRHARGIVLFDPARARVLDWIETAPAPLAAALPDDR